MNGRRDRGRVLYEGVNPDSGLLKGQIRGESKGGLEMLSSGSGLIVAF
jgi:hypothetical protein